MSFFEAAAGLYELLRLRANCLRNGYEIRLMSLEEAYACGEQRGIGSAAPQLICPDTGQIEEAMRPPVVGERCRKCG